ncbi:MFS transporter [Streptomyces sp. FXJ1.172]|uniref:MFS transporter n=1 Tax=Streptomyces sp. FXJ1.172 TaxID=710705 RepID=UPI0007CF8D7D|nr:MFS transporter [Streptomyces sp. FXJ1.172]WEO93328.1 MFS transporter [Streptomyces sp. FXJ1.172]
MEDIGRSRLPRRSGKASTTPGAAPPPADTGIRTAGGRDLTVLWGINFIDGLGSQASGLVFPLLLLDLGHGRGTAGAFASAAALAGVVLSPFVALPADRGRRRTLMTGTSVSASLAMAGLAACCLGHPPLWVLLGLALTERLCATAYEAAARGALSRLAGAADLPRAVAGVQAGDQAALVLGPALGGVLFSVSPLLPFAVDAGSYAAAAFGVRAVRTPLDGTPAGPPHGPDAPGNPADVPPATSAMVPDSPRSSSDPPVGTVRSGALRAGVAAVVGSPVLRLVLLWSSAASGAVALLFYNALFVLGTEAGSIATGGVLAASGAAGLAGSLVAARAVRRLGAHRSLTVATWLLLPPCAALSVAREPWSWTLCFCGLCLVLPVVTVVLGAAAVRAVPAELQSRSGAVLGSAGALTAAGGPAGAALLMAWGGPGAPAVACTVILALLAVHTQHTANTVLRPLTPAHADQDTGRTSSRAGGAR